MLTYIIAQQKFVYGFYSLLLIHYTLICQGDYLKLPLHF